MKICAVICEYNPFHHGHAYQFEKIREKFDRIICIMSGNFTQRAEPAIFDKYVRAEQAVLSGADIVIQLPTPYACSAAPVFAKGAINILRNLPIDAISFGMEDDNLDLAISIAECENNPTYKEMLKANLDNGRSYISSSIEAIKKCLENETENLSDFLSKPNNMLAIEYLKAINEYGLDWEIYPIKRESNYNSNSLDGKFVSASAIRYAFENGIDITQHIPHSKIIQSKPTPDKKLFETLTLYSLKNANGNIHLIADAGEGIENKLVKNALTCTSLQEALDRTKTKRYSFARIKRLSLFNILSVKKDDIAFPENATAILLAIKKDFLPYLKTFSPYLITENSQLDKFVPSNFVKIEENAEKLYTTICNTAYNGIIKKLVKV